MRITSLGLLFLLTGCFPGPQECFREVRCVEACGGEETTAGCGPCPDGTFDSIECPATDAGQDAQTCAPMGAGCDAVECCGGADCCIVYFGDGGAGGYLCVAPGTGGTDCI
jgi:hypothetical protein